MKPPSEFELEKLFVKIHEESLTHTASTPEEIAYQHEYYLRNRKLKGRKAKGPNVVTYEDGSSERMSQKEFATFKAGARVARSGTGVDPRTGKTMEQIHKEALAFQRRDLGRRIAGLSQRLSKLEMKIRKMESEESRENRKAVADKNKAAKERDDPKTAAEKAKIARENKKYRDKNQAKLKSKAAAKSGGSSSSSSSDKKSSSSGASVSDLRSLATKVKGQIAMAKQQLAALQ